MKFSISEVFEKIAAFPTDEERVLALRANQSVAMNIILKYSLDPSVKFGLPEGPVPYKPNIVPDSEGVLFHNVRKLYRFVDEGDAWMNLTLEDMASRNSLKNPRRATQRQNLFISMLESITPGDANLLIAMKDKKWLYPAITRDVVNTAFPGLLEPVVEVKKAKAPVKEAVTVPTTIVVDDPPTSDRKRPGPKPKPQAPGAKPKKKRPPRTKAALAAKAAEKAAREAAATTPVHTYDGPGVSPMVAPSPSLIALATQRQQVTAPVVVDVHRDADGVIIEPPLPPDVEVFEYEDDRGNKAVLEETPAKAEVFDEFGDETNG